LASAVALPWDGLSADGCLPGYLLKIRRFFSR